MRAVQLSGQAESFAPDFNPVRVAETTARQMTSSRRRRLTRYAQSVRIGSLRLMRLAQDTRIPCDRAGLGRVKRHVDVDVQGGVSRDQDEATLSAELIWPGRRPPEVVLARHQAKRVTPT